MAIANAVRARWPGNDYSSGMTETSLLVLIVSTFLLAGAVKGVIGLGLPTVSLGLLAAATDIETAMALLIVPSLATNLWQAIIGGHVRAILRRTWPFLLAATATIGIGAQSLTRVDGEILAALLGVLLLAHAITSLAGLRLTVSPARERWAGPLFGTMNGLLTGMTGSFVVPGVLYLQGIGLSRDELVQAMGMLFAASTIALALALGGHGLLTRELSLASALAVAPAFAGMWVGQRIRRRLSEARFRQVFLFGIAALGVYLVAESLRAL